MEMTRAEFTAFWAGQNCSANVSGGGWEGGGAGEGNERSGGNLDSSDNSRK